MKDRSLTVEEREFRHAILLRDNHTCRYCGAKAHQIDFVSTSEKAVACCRDCLAWLKKIPSTWDIPRRQHLIDTMRIAHPVRIRNWKLKQDRKRPP